MLQFKKNVEILSKSVVEKIQTEMRGQTLTCHFTLYVAVESGTRWYIDCFYKAHFKKIIVAAHVLKVFKLGHDTGFAS